MRWLCLFWIVVLLLPSTVKAESPPVFHSTGNTIQFGDWTPPVSTLSILHQTQTFPIQSIEKVLNGTFTDGLVGWQTTGIATTSAAGLQLGGPDDTEPNLANSLQQSIASGASQLHIDFEVFSLETEPDLDDPALEVELNDHVVAQVSARELPATDSGTLRRSGLLSWNVNLGQLSTDPISVRVRTGNTGDNLLPSWAMIHTITTTVPSIINSDRLVLQCADTHSGCSSLYSWDTQLQTYLSPLQPPFQNRLSLQFRSQDSAGNQEEWRQLTLQQAATPSGIVSLQTQRYGSEVLVSGSLNHQPALTERPLLMGTPTAQLSQEIVIEHWEQASPLEFNLAFFLPSTGFHHFELCFQNEAFECGDIGRFEL